MTRIVKRISVPAKGGSDVIQKPLDRWGQAVAAYQIGISIWEKVQAKRSEIQERGVWRVYVDSDDRLYHLAMRWLANELPADSRSSLVVVSEYQDNGVWEARSQYDATRSPEATVRLQGHEVKIRVETPESVPQQGKKGSGETSESPKSYSTLFQDRLVFSVRSEVAREAVLTLLRSLYQYEKPVSGLFINSPWDGWDRRNDLPTRDLDSVILRAGVKESLRGDLQRFLDAETDYARLGVPWRRGYLLHGPPGTGKTSIARALATDTGMDVYYLPLTTLKDDASLNRKFSQIRPRSMLLLEDIDVLHAAKSRDSEGVGVSLSGLLNALDGVITPHGLIVVMTTNKLEALDEALTRTGRSDLVVEIAGLNSEQYIAIIEKFVGDLVVSRAFRTGTLYLALRQGRVTLSAADVVEVIKQNLNSPGELFAAFEALGVESEHEWDSQVRS